MQLPENVAFYKRTPEFDQDSVPRGLLQDHRTKAGVWGVIKILSVTLCFTITEGEHAGTQTLGAAASAVIEPEIAHHVAPIGQVRFFVEFHRAADG